MNKIINWASALSLGFRMITGSFHFIFLSALLITPQEIAALEGIFSITMLLLQYPTGLYADYSSPKKAILFGLIFVASHFFIYLLFPSFALLIFSEVLLAIGVSFLSGSFECWSGIATRALYPNDDRKITYNNHHRYEVSSLAVVVGGLLGSWFARFANVASFRSAYLFAGLGCLFTICFVAFIPNFSSNYKSLVNSTRNSKNASLNCLFFKQMKFVLFSEAGLTYLLLSFPVISAYQVALHFWQPLFRGDLDESKILYTSATFCFAHLCSYFVHKWCRAMIHKVTDRLLFFTAIIAISVALFILGIDNLPWWTIFIVYGLLRSQLTLIDVIRESYIFNNLKFKEITGVFSQFYIIERFFAILALTVITWALNKGLNVSKLFWLPIIPMGLIFFPYTRKVLSAPKSRLSSE